MPALKPTSYTGKITWLGRVIDAGNSLRSETLQRADLSFAGIAKECHGGLTRPACTRVKAQHPKGTEIRNVRQLTILSAEELAVIAQKMELEAVDPAWIGASMVIEGIPDFSHVPPSSRLQMPSGACLGIDMENRPCVFPGREIDKDRPGFGPKFKPAAVNRRGVTAWVEREGPISVGDTVTLHIPDQPIWSELKGGRR